MFCRQKFLGVLFSSIVNETNKAISNLFISFYEKMLHTQKVQNRYKRTKTKNPSIFMPIKKRLRGGKSLVQLFASLCLLCFLCFLVLFVCVKFSRKKRGLKLPWWPPSHFYCHLFKYCSSWLLAVTPKTPLVVNTISIDSSTHLRSYLRSIWQLLNAMAKEVEIRVTVDSWVRLQLDIINWFALSKKCLDDIQ